MVLITVPRANQRIHPSESVRHLHAHRRQVIERVNRQLALRLHVETNHAHNLRGLTARLHTKLTAHTAHTLCVWLNRLLRVADVLHLKEHAFPNN